MNFLSVDVDWGVDMPSQKNPILNRRKEVPEQSILWSKLSLAQKFSASSLGKFGYKLSFIRNDEGHSLAVLRCDSGIVVITEDGDINTSPTIEMR
ncbi:MAG: hypothetical protein ACI9VT_003603 [Psychroserpens sp.]|jgi:hypothetical protein